MNRIEITAPRLDLVRAIKALLPLTRGGSNPRLAGVHVSVDANGNCVLTATNGHLAARVTLADGRVHVWSGSRAPSIFIPAPHAKEMVRASAFRTKRGPEDATLVWEIAPVSLVPYLAVQVAGVHAYHAHYGTDCHIPGYGPVGSAHDEYPDVTRVWPQAPAGDSMQIVNLDPAYLATCAKLFSDLGALGVQISGDHADRLSPVMLSAYFGDNSNAQVVLMPRSGDRAPWGCIPMGEPKPYPEAA